MKAEIRHNITGIEASIENLMRDIEIKLGLKTGGVYHVSCEYGDCFDGKYSHCEVEVTNAGNNVWMNILVCFDGVKNNNKGRAYKARCFADDIAKVEELLY